MAFPFQARGTGTDQELLDLVREAIAVIVGGGAQEYEIRGRRYTRADLTTLYRMETDLQLRVARASTGLTKNRVRLARKPTLQPDPNT